MTARVGHAFRRVRGQNLDGRGEDLFIGTSRGQIIWYDIRDARDPKRAGVASVGDAPVTALGLLIGDRTLVVGDGRGGVSTWQLLPGLGGGERRLTPIHRFQGHRGPVVAHDGGHRGVDPAPPTKPM